jgi:hypothetical protein
LCLNSISQTSFSIIYYLGDGESKEEGEEGEGGIGKEGNHGSRVSEWLFPGVCMAVSGFAWLNFYLSVSEGG